MSFSHASEERLRAFTSLTEEATGNLDVDEILQKLLARVCGLLDADTAAVLLLDKSGRQLVARAAHGVEEEVRQGVRVQMGRGFAGRVASERRPIALDHIDASTVENPVLWEKGIRAMLGVPLESGSRLLGVLHVGSFAERLFTPDEAVLLGLAGERVATAIQARELEIERTAARVLQRSLLPSALPQFSGIEFATRYVPAEAGGVGGDWYDAFELKSGDLWLMTGDVAGHGLAAAVIMGRLRATLRSYALQSTEPAEVLALANEKLRFFEPEHMATVLCARLREPYDSIRLSTAGHLPPVLAVPGEEIRLIQMPPAMPIGVVDDLRPHTIDIAFPEGAVLVAYTDGLIERRGESLDVGLERLVQAVQAKDPEILCRELMDALVGSSIPQDDTAVIVMRRNPRKGARI